MFRFMILLIAILVLVPNVFGADFLGATTTVSTSDFLAANDNEPAPTTCPGGVCVRFTNHAAGTWTTRRISTTSYSSTGGRGGAYLLPWRNRRAVRQASAASFGVGAYLLPWRNRQAVLGLR